jgi:hypothetical protein
MYSETLIVKYLLHHSRLFLLIHFVKQNLDLFGRILPKSGAELPPVTVRDVEGPVVVSQQQSLS